MQSMHTLELQKENHIPYTSAQEYPSDNQDST
jgi:hypothetical protein